MLTFIIQDPPTPAVGCVIWLHGLGSNAADMASVAAQFPSLPVRHVFVNAPVRPVTLNGGLRMQAWYDIIGMKLTDREDIQGLTQSRQQVMEVIETQMKAGWHANKIVLMGFSQGGAMALYTALHTNLPLAGVGSLSAYLPNALGIKPVLPLKTPFFIGYGQYDPVVLPAWTAASKQWLTTYGFNHITYQGYPIEHTISLNEINDLKKWLIESLSGANVA